MKIPLFPPPGVPSGGPAGEVAQDGPPPGLGVAGLQLCRTHRQVSFSCFMRCFEVTFEVSYFISST